MRRAQDRARSARSRKFGARSATIKSRDENVPAKRADFFYLKIYIIQRLSIVLERKIANFK